MGGLAVAVHVIKAGTVNEGEIGGQQSPDLFIPDFANFSFPSYLLHALLRWLQTVP
jgi:hypothetical protein